MAEMRRLSRPEVQQLAQILAERLPPDEIASLLQTYLKMPRPLSTASPDAQSTLLGLYDALSKDTGGYHEFTRLIVTDACETDGRVVGSTRTLPSGVQRVYAVFENASSLAGLPSVFAVWRSLDRDQLVFAEFEPLRSSTPYNYVWAQANAGCPPGHYRIDLFHPENTSRLLASQTFEIR